MNKINLTRHGFWLIRNAVRMYSEIAKTFSQSERELAEGVLKALNKIELKSVEGVEITKEKPLV